MIGTSNIILFILSFAIFFIIISGLILIHVVRVQKARKLRTSSVTAKPMPETVLIGGDSPMREPVKKVKRGKRRATREVSQDETTNTSEQATKYAV